jgi:predicted metalloprotease with PDZ domain
MHYKFSFPEIHKHLINIDLIFSETSNSDIQLQLPAWRPGRYELSNYGKNLMNIKVEDLNGNSLKFSRTTKESWMIAGGQAEKIKVSYKMYSAQMDAGGSWVDESLIYINFINNIIYVKGHENSPAEVTLEIPVEFRIACGLPFKDQKIAAPSIYTLLDSPLLASPDLEVRSYTAASTEFYIWCLGHSFRQWDKVVEDFRKFTEYQIEVMGEFPEKEYHFLNIFLPYRFHHGVEHANSTVIVLGESNLMETKDYYDNFSGISSHELFHAWNICKIRPAEMLPYNFTKENYFRTGFVAEGFTTYYGDLFLAKSGVYSIDDYFSELNLTFKRHFENFGRFNYSIADSSFDLWIDGYVAGVAGRKVSIYVKGCVLALLIDLEIRKATQNQKSLDDVMRKLYYDFSKSNRGYTIEDIQTLCEDLSGISFNTFFERFITGTEDETQRLSENLEWAGCQLQVTNSETGSERIYGFRTLERGDHIFISDIEPGSPADRFLAKDDEVLEIDGEPAKTALNKISGEKNYLDIKVWKRSGERIYRLSADQNNYFKQYRITKNTAASEQQKENFKNWLNKEF